MTEAQERISLLARKNRGRAAIPIFLNGLSKVLGESFDVGALVSLLETDALATEFRNAYTRVARGTDRGFRKSYQRDEGAKVFRTLNCLAQNLEHEEVFLLMTQSELCGAVMLNGMTLLKHAESVLRLDRDSVRVLSQDQSQGLLVDFNPDDPECVYEVAAWGDRWSRLALACHSRQPG